MGLFISIGSGSGITGKLVATLFGLFFAAFGCFFVSLTFSSLLETIAMQRWQETPCTITLNKMQDAGKDYELVLRYTYLFDGQTYAAERYSSNDRYTSPSVSDIDRMQKSLPVGKKTRCYVDSGKPAEAMLVMPTVASALVAVGLTMLFPCFGLFFAALPWLRSRKKAQKPKKESSGKGLMILFGAIFAMAGILMLKPILITPLQKTRAAQHWEAVPATVISSKVKSHDSDDGTTYSVYIAYRYEIDGIEYVGDRYTFMGGSSSGYDGKAAVIRNYPKGFRFEVFVDPSNPTESVINHEYSPSLLFGLIPLVFVGAGIAVMVAGIRNRKSKLDAVQAGEHIVELKGPSPAKKAVGISTFTAIWLGIVYFLSISDAPLLFPVVFGFFGIILLGATIHAILAIFNPQPTVEITPGDIHPGTNVAMRWRTAGRTDRIQSLSIKLQCLKITTETRRSGGKTSTSIVKKPLHEVDLLQTQNQAEIAQGTLQFTLSKEQPASRPGNQNGISWQLVFHGDIGRWPDMKTELPFTVYP